MSEQFEYAKITSTFIGMIGDEMRMVITFSFPSYCAYYDDILDACGIQHMRKIIDVVGSGSWEHLRGRYAWVRTNGFGGDAVAIRGVGTDKQLNLLDLRYDRF